MNDSQLHLPENKNETVFEIWKKKFVKKLKIKITTTNDNNDISKIEKIAR